MILDASVERTIVSLAVMMMSTALLLALPNEATVIIPLVGTWMGALIANWFNGIQTPTIPLSKGPTGTTTTTISHTEEPPNAN